MAQPLTAIKSSRRKSTGAQDYPSLALAAQLQDVIETFGMASQPSSSISGHGNLHCLEIQSFVRGYHAYMDSWTPVIGETLLLKREPTNPRDKNAVAIYKYDAVVGHVPYNLAPYNYLSRFLA